MTSFLKDDPTFDAVVDHVCAAYDDDVRLYMRATALGINPAQEAFSDADDLGDLLKRTSKGASGVPSQIKTCFSDYAIKLTPERVRAVVGSVISFEIERAHALALNTNVLGVHPIAFTPAHYSALFRTFDLSEDRIRADIKRRIPAIRPEWKVVSDPFNLLSIWLLYLSGMYLKGPTKTAFDMAVSKMLCYKFFTSLVKNFFRHGAKEAYMLATLESLNNRFDIIRYGTWRGVIEAQCADLIAESSPHVDTLKSMVDDAKVIYVLSDMQTRLRQKLRLIANVYYEVEKRGEKIGSRSTTDTDLEGEKTISQMVSQTDSIISRMTVEVANVHRWYDRRLTDVVVARFSALSASHLGMVLELMSARASMQQQSKQTTLTKKQSDGSTIYIGVPLLVSTVVRTIYRYCINNGVDVTNKAKVYTTMQSAFSASRTSDRDILDIKESVGALVSDAQVSQRPATLSSLRLAVVLYIVAKALTA